MGSHAHVAVAVWACELRYAYRNSPRPRCSVLELAFSTAEIFYFYCSCPVCMSVCVFALICRLTYWNHKSEVPTDSSQYWNDLVKNVSFKSYAVICKLRVASASQHFFFFHEISFHAFFLHEISFYASFEGYSYVFTAHTTDMWKTAYDSLAQTRKRHRYTDHEY